MACSRSNQYKVYRVYYVQTGPPHFGFTTYRDGNGCHFSEMDRDYMLKFIQYLQPPILKIEMTSRETTDESISKCEEALKCIKTGELFLLIRILCY